MLPLGGVAPYPHYRPTTYRCRIFSGYRKGHTRTSLDIDASRLFLYPINLDSSPLFGRTRSMDILSHCRYPSHYCNRILSSERNKTHLDFLETRGLILHGILKISYCVVAVRPHHKNTAATDVSRNSTAPW